MDSGIYAIINKINNKIYVGSTINFKKRWIKHKTELRNKKHHSKHLENAWHAHGEENFQFKVLEEVENIQDLINKEQYYLDFYKSYREENGYNICEFAETVRGVRRSEEEKINLSKHFNPKSCMDLELAKQIRNKYSTGKYSHRELAKEFNTSKTTIKEIIYNTRWVDNNYLPPKKSEIMKRGGKKILTEKQFHKIKKLRKETNLTIKEMAKKFKVKIGVINRVIYNDVYKKIG
jgi:group I intron endonuclease